ncbi:MAG: helix-turn-helix transcriptional regulator [bacterium]
MNDLSIYCDLLITQIELLQSNLKTHFGILHVSSPMELKRLTKTHSLFCFLICRNLRDPSDLYEIRRIVSVVPEVPSVYYGKDDHFLKYRKVEVIARKLGISRESLTRTLKKECGICPKKFITCMRHYLAAYFLARTQFPVKTIARKCKFDNEHVFCKSFKSTIGLTATQFRSRHKWKDDPVEGQPYSPLLVV